MLKKLWSMWFDRNDISELQEVLRCQSALKRQMNILRRLGYASRGDFKDKETAQIIDTEGNLRACVYAGTRNNGYFIEIGSCNKIEPLMFKRQ